MPISTEQELAAALARNQDTIEIEGNLCTKVLRIKATGAVAWGIAIGAIGIAVVVALGTGGVGAPASGFVALGAVSVLGMPAAISAVAIAVAAGGISALNSLREYKIDSQDGNRVVLKRM